MTGRLLGWRPGRLTRAYLAYLAAVLAVGVRGELRRPAPSRAWHGRALGAPWDLRRPTLSRLAAPHVDPALPIVGEQGFGAGWCLNWGAIARRLGLLPARSAARPLDGWRPGGA